MGLMAPPIKYPDETPQFDSIIDDFGGGRGNPQSEDCLTLNVWTKRPGSAQKTGVLLWIHGGSKLLRGARVGPRQLTSARIYHWGHKHAFLPGPVSR